MEVMKKQIIAITLLFISPLCAAKDNSEAVFKKDFGASWPLKFDSAVLTCIPGGAVFVMNPKNDKAYPVNGTASAFVRSGRVKGEDLKSVWLDNPDWPGTKIGIGELLERGLTLCD